MSRLPALLLLSFLPLVAPGTAGASSRLAVLTFSAPWSSRCAAGDWGSDAALAENCTALETFADEARAGALAAVETKDVEVMTRENAAQLLESMEGSRCVEGECEVETAKLIGADYVVSGNVSQLEGTWILTLKMHSTKNARLLGASIPLQAKGRVALLDKIRTAAESLVRNGLRKEPAGTAVSAGAPKVAQKPGVADMVRLPGGTFKLGQAALPVTVAPFMLDATEVTVAAYAECVNAKTCTPASTTVDWPGIADAERDSWSQSCNGDRTDRKDHPVNCVDWQQATAYCAWAGKRLPSEQEWEWAARSAVPENAYPWGDEAPSNQACWSGEGNDQGLANRSSTCPVGSHPRGDSAQGISDLSGNVWEWTSTVRPCNVAGKDLSCRVDRGGGWRDANPSAGSATASGTCVPNDRGSVLGFRCAKAP